LLFGWNFPGAHSSHAPTPTALLAVPIEQGRQKPELLAPVIG
jgi:hypothetical protein